jgi:hypothetical protein
MLQTTNILPIQRRRARGDAGRRLLQVEQCSQHPLLPVRLVQGRRHGAGPPGLAQGLHPHDHRPRRPRLHLGLWLLRLGERSPLRVIRGKPHLQDQSTLGTTTGAQRNDLFVWFIYSVSFFSLAEFCTYVSSLNH